MEAAEATDGVLVHAETATCLEIVRSEPGPNSASALALAADVGASIALARMFQDAAGEDGGEIEGVVVTRSRSNEITQILPTTEGEELILSLRVDGTPASLVMARRRLAALESAVALDDASRDRLQALAAAIEAEKTTTADIAAMIESAPSQAAVSMPSSDLAPSTGGRKTLGQKARGLLRGARVLLDPMLVLIPTQDGNREAGTTG